MREDDDEEKDDDGKEKEVREGICLSVCVWGWEIVRSGPVDGEAVTN